MRPVFQPATWLLPLTSGARKLVTTFIVLGSLVLAGYIAGYAVFIGSVVSSTVSTVTAISQLDRSYTTLSDSLDTWEQATASCDKNLTCVTKQDSNAASAFNTFSGQLASTPVPAAAAADKARLSADAAAAAADFTQLSKTTTDRSVPVHDQQHRLAADAERLRPGLQHPHQEPAVLLTGY